MLALSNTKVSDAGLIHVNGLTNLQALILSGTPVTGAGLAHLKGLGNLQSVDLGFTPVNDGALAHIRALTGLQVLNLDGTRVTEGGIESLHQALPQVRMAWSNIDQERAINEIERLGGSIQRDTRRLSKPIVSIRIVAVANAGPPRARLTQLKSLARLNALTRLESLDLRDTGITVAEVRELPLKELTCLQAIDLRDTAVTGAEVAELQQALPRVKIIR